MATVCATMCAKATNAPKATKANNVPKATKATIAPNATTTTNATNPTHPTPYRISTITCNGDLGTPIVLRALYENLPITTTEDAIKAPGWVFVELSMEEFRGIDPNEKRRNNKERKSFVNQVTLIYDTGIVGLKTPYRPNIKLFKNGNVHMTGIRSTEDGKAMVERIAGELRTMAAANVPVVPDASRILASDFKCRMINCDFGAPFRIRRKDLHNMLIASPFNNVSSFQPGTYPGVKIQYFWNKMNAVQADTAEAAEADTGTESKEVNVHAEGHSHGRCECAHYHDADAPCMGNGTGDGVGQCKKVTIAVFESGKILITGATSIPQVDAAYEFIVHVLMAHSDRLTKNIATLV